MPPDGNGGFVVSSIYMILTDCYALCVLAILKQMKCEGIKVEIKIINKAFSVCKLENIKEVNFEDEYCFIGKTDEELSLVCDTRFVPSNTVSREDGWRAFRIEGILDFSLIGILSEISGILAKAEIGIFAISTYNTDYILVQEDNFRKALEALEMEGYEIKE